MVTYLRVIRYLDNMNIELIVNEIDAKLDYKLPIIESFSNEINTEFKNKNYGSSIENFILICILVKTKPGYEAWYIPRKPKYIESKIYKNKLTGQELEIKRQYTIEFKIDYELYDEFAVATEELSKKILANKILESFSHLDKLSKKIDDFDKDKFKKDVEKFFQEQGII